LTNNQESKQPSIMSNRPQNPGEEIPVMALPDAEPPKEWPGWDFYAFRCAACGTCEGIAPVAMRKYGGIVGLVFACALCGPKIAGRTVDVRLSDIDWHANLNGP
jgi:hypothetical protein